MLIAADIISEEAYLAALTASHDIVFEPLDDLPRSAVLLSDEQLLDAASTGILPIITDGNLHFVVAPRALSARWLVEGVRNGSELASRMRVTTAERIQKFIARHGAQAIAQRATEALYVTRPALSARSCKLRPAVVVAFLASLVLTLISIPSNVLSIFSLAMTFIFLAWSVHLLPNAAITQKKNSRSSSFWNPTTAKHACASRPCGSPRRSGSSSLRRGHRAPNPGR